MTTRDPAQDAFETWKRMLDEGTQAWVKALGQTPGPQSAPGMPDFGQFWRPILTQGLDAWQKVASQGGVSPDLAQQWKSFMDQWVEACSKALGQAMATEGFAKALGSYLDQMLTAQAPLRQGMEQYTDQALRTLGLPSRRQMVGLATQVVGLEERLEAIEERLDELRGLLRSGTPGPGRPGSGEAIPAAAGTRSASAGRPGGRPSARRAGKPRGPKEGS